MNNSFPGVIRRAIGCATLLFGLAFAAMYAQAQDAYPDKPVRLIVPQPAGGTGDVVSRLVGQRLAIRLGKPVVIENRPGAGGTIGAALVAKSPPDGYTLVMASPGFSTFAALYTGSGLNPATDFAPVGMMAMVPIAAIVRADAPYEKMSDFIAYAKKNPGKASFSSAGQGSLSHLMGAWFKAAAGLDMLQVPYAGSAPSLTALLGGQVDITFDPMASAQLLKAGKVRAIAVTDASRSPMLPDVPTLGELGVPVRGSVWLGVMAPAGTPRSVLDRLNRDLDAVLREPELRAALTAAGVQPEPMSIADFARFFEADTRNLTKLVRDNSIKVN